MRPRKTTGPVVSTDLIQTRLVQSENIKLNLVQVDELISPTLTRDVQPANNASALHAVVVLIAPIDVKDVQFLNKLEILLTIE